MHCSANDKSYVSHKKHRSRPSSVLYDPPVYLLMVLISKMTYDNNKYFYFVFFKFNIVIVQRKWIKVKGCAVHKR